MSRGRHREPEALVIKASRSPTDPAAELTRRLAERSVMRCDGPRSPGAPPILKRAERPERHRGCEDRSPTWHGVRQTHQTYKGLGSRASGLCRVPTKTPRPPTPRAPVLHVNGVLFAVTAPGRSRDRRRRAERGNGSLRAAAYAPLITRHDEAPAGTGASRTA